jgi:hypothetical protein
VLSKLHLQNCTCKIALAKLHLQNCTCKIALAKLLLQGQFSLVTRFFLGRFEHEEMKLAKSKDNQQVTQVAHQATAPT